MPIVSENKGVWVVQGDCLTELRSLKDNSIDSIVTDPPYGLSNTDPKHVAETLTKWVTGDHEYTPPAKGGFMGKTWDSFVPPPAVWNECMRVLKPGGHLLVFAGTRTQDLMGLSIRLAGFDIRDGIGWIYGSGFPKSMDVSKAIDKRGGSPHLAQQVAEAIKSARESRGWTTSRADKHFCGGTTNWTWFEGRKGEYRPPTPETFARIVAEWPELAEWAEKVAEAEREVVGKSSHKSGIGNATRDHYTVGGTKAEAYDITAPATPEAERWAGWGTALKPAIEPVIVARKPIKGTVAANVLAHGTGGINVDGCRVATTDNLNGGAYAKVGGRTESASLRAGSGMNVPGKTTGKDFEQPEGRFPPNVLLDPEAATEMDRQSGNLSPGARPGNTATRPKFNGATYNSGKVYDGKMDEPRAVMDSGGGASRFFPVFKYQAKAPKKERPSHTTEDGTEVKHPTVKPLELMRWLVRLVTPPDGIVLDPFSGSGTTAEAAINEGFRCVAIEGSEEYLPLINARIERAEPTQK